MATFEIIVRQENFEEPDIQWKAWFLVFVCGFMTGASADLFSLWLFAHWMSR